MQQAFVNLRTGSPKPLQPPVEGYIDQIAPPLRSMLDQVLTSAAIGSPDTVRTALRAFIARTEADELMITAQIFDHAARRRSYEIAADIRNEDGTSDGIADSMGAGTGRIESRAATA